MSLTKSLKELLNNLLVYEGSNINTCCGENAHIYTTKTKKSIEFVSDVYHQRSNDPSILHAPRTNNIIKISHVFIDVVLTYILLRILNDLPFNDCVKAKAELLMTKKSL